MSDTLLYLELDLKSGGSETGCSHRRGKSRYRLVGLSVNQENRRFVAHGRDGRGRKKTRKRNERANRPAATGNCVEGDDRALRHANECDAKVSVAKSFPVNDLANDCIKGGPHSLDPFGLELISVNVEPLMATRVGKGRVESNETRVWKRRAPG